MPVLRRLCVGFLSVLLFLFGTAAAGDTLFLDDVQVLAPTVPAVPSGSLRPPSAQAPAQPRPTAKVTVQVRQDAPPPLPDIMPGASAPFQAVPQPAPAPARVVPVMPAPVAATVDPRLLPSPDLEPVSVNARPRQPNPAPAARPARRSPPPQAKPKPKYDELPLRFEDMDQYDQIAMEPYRDEYDDLPVDEKARVYGQQFEFMRDRAPNFDPRLFGDVPEEEPEPVQAVPVPEAPQPHPQRRPEGGPPRRYDRLPLRFADMNPYDQIAMEPYKEKYDSLTVGEKAKLYGQQFEFMRNRPPRFDPRVLQERDRFTEAEESTDAIAKKQYLYKPAIAKQHIPKPDPEQQAQALLGALPGPWEQNRPPPSAVPEPQIEREPTYQDFEDDPRMESLRQGWNAIDVIRGRRQR